MNSSIDLNLLLLARQGINLTSELPDLYAVTPPRRTARGRELDNLIIYLTMSGNSPLSPETQSQLMEQLAHKFYKTTGSLTAAMRTIVEALNLYLLDRNLRSTSLGRQGIGQLLLVASRADTLYLAQSGTVHAFVVTPKETQDLYDPQSSGRGLGFSRNTSIRFLQAKLVPGDYLVLATNASPNWTEATLHNPLNQGIEALRSQLLETTNQDFNVVLIQVQAGTGKLRLLRRKAEAPEVAHPAMAEPPPAAISTETPTTPIKPIEGMVENHLVETPPSDIAPVERISTVEEKNIPLSPSESSAVSEVSEDISKAEELGIPPSTSPPMAPAPEIIAPSGETTESMLTAPISAVVPQPQAVEEETSATLVEPAVTSVPEPEPAFPSPHPRRERRPAKPAPWAKYLASFRSTMAPAGTAILTALRNALGTIGAALLRLLKNLLPDADVLRLPPSMMVFIAIAVPLILAVVGGMVFLKRGRAQQYQIYYQNAVEQADYAAGLTDPQEQRVALQSVLTDLDKAEYYTLTSESQGLRVKVVTQLDSLNAVKRLDYKQAIVGGLGPEINVTHMVATTTDLYLLNGTQGNVLRAIMTGRGYEIDPNFQCGPTYGPINVGPLVDIAELPPGSFENASLLGMDANGSLLYCVVDSQPYSASMAPPNTGFGEPSAMSLDRGDIFLLDPKVNAVWIYRNMEVSQQPHLFFGETVPPMQDVIDLAVYNNDLFLLHADGHITKCTYSSMAESPTRCDDPYPYSDNRPGRAHGPVIADAVFNQMYFSSFPERSIYLLDPQNQSIYYFSVLLTLQWQYQSRIALTDNKATAFAISPNRMAYLAIGNNVYYAAIP